uniref:Prefoldin subunit 1 n=1 Tax=Cucumis melo TaxID=3656 RepID=A0A9I9DMJ4_CUCME
MAADGGFSTAAFPSITKEEQKLEITKQMRSLEVAIAELNHLSSTRAVYQKNGNLFFRTTVQKATTSEQKKLDAAKARLERLNS